MISNICFASLCDCKDKIKYIVSNEMDFNKTQIIIGKDFNKIFLEKGDWITKSIPINVEDNKIIIKIKIKDKKWKIIENKTHELKAGRNIILINYIDENDKKLNIKIVIYLCTKPTDAPTSTQTDIMTSTPTDTDTPTNTPTDTPIPTDTNSPTNTPNITQSPIQTEGDQLPQTGEASNILFIILSILLLLTGIYFLLKDKIHKNNI
jgi:LPXTG-motif cell wall-anchored protein